MSQDLRLAWRQLRLHPGYAAVALLSLTLGIGATTAVFNLVNALVLKRLPVLQPEELVWFGDPGFSYPIYQELRARSIAAFSGFFAWNADRFHVDWSGELESTQALAVSGEFFPALGVRPARGRLLTDGDETAVVISHKSWQRRFGADPGVVGRTIRIERTPFTIAGITPPEFFGVAPGIEPEIVLPIAALPVIRPQEAGILRSPTSSWLHMMARRKPGIDIARASAVVRTVWPQVLEATIIESMPRERRRQYLERPIRVVEGATGFSRVRRQFEQPLLLLLGLVTLLLLVCCATVANLMLARMSARRGEIAVRQALGAGRRRLMRQLLTEGLLLSALGALGGLAVAAWGSDLLLAMLSTGRDPIRIDLTMDWRVLGFTVGIAMASAAVFTLAPAWGATRPGQDLALHENRRVVGRGRRRWLGRALVISQTAHCLVLLSGAALFLRSLHHLVSLDAGFDPRDVVVIAPDPLAAGIRGPRLVGFYQDLLTRLQRIPGVQSASLSWAPPISNELGSWTQSIAIDGALVSGQQSYTYFNAVSPGYFRTLGTTLLQGRDFGTEDRESAKRTVIINESLAWAFLPGQNPIGRRISIGRNASRQDLEIVGVVRDAKYQRLQEPTRRIAYLPYMQLPEFLNGSNLVAEVRGPGVSEIGATVRREIRALDAGVPVRVETLAGRIQESLVNERVLSAVSGFLGIVSLLLASAGLYGLAAHDAGRRTNEIGIRMALGARPRDVQWMVLRESIALGAAGLAAGLTASLLLTRTISSMVHGIAPTDPVALTAAGVLLAGVLVLAAFLPARRASRLDPAGALRKE